MRRNGGLPAAAATLSLAILVFPPALAQLPGEAPQGNDYQSGDYGRIRYQINGLSVMRAELNLQTPASINSPIYPGDTVQTAFDQRAEVELAGGSLVRVDSGTDLTFLALPDPYASFQDNTVLQLGVGAIRVNTRLVGSEEFRIDTPAGSIYLLGNGDFRIEVTGTGHTRVISRRGVAEAGGQLGSVLVRGGMHTEIYPNSLPAQPEPFNTFASDGFDRWVEERQSAYRYASGYGDTEVYDTLPAEVQPYYGELEAHGDWAYAEDYGYVWSPSTVGADWRPYYDGYWDYGPGGYFWVSSEPWGWAPYHFGRWVRAPGFGWCWAPGRIFGGAWVAWSWGTSYIGWAPLGYWNRPAVYGTPYYDYYDAHSWTFVHHTDLGAHRYHKYPRRESVHGVDGELRTSALITRPPRVAPEQLAGSASARVAAAREAQSGPRIAAPSATDSQPTGSSFRTTEARMAARGDLRRTAISPPAVTSSTASEPMFSAPRRRSNPPVTSSPPSIAGGYSDPAPRSVVSTPRRITEDAPTEPRTGSRTYTERRSAPSAYTTSPGDTGRQRTLPGAPVRTVTPQADPRRTQTGPRGEDLRELYRRISEPRITLKRSDAAGPSSKSVSGSSRKKPPTVRKPTRSGGNRSSTSKPSPSKPTPRSSSGSRKSSSGSKKKSDGGSRGGRRR